MGSRWQDDLKSPAILHCQRGWAVLMDWKRFLKDQVSSEVSDSRKGLLDPASRVSVHILSDLDVIGSGVGVTAYRQTPVALSSFYELPTNTHQGLLAPVPCLRAYNLWRRTAYELSGGASRPLQRSCYAASPTSGMNRLAST